jgi:hypothetical protein
VLIHRYTAIGIRNLQLKQTPVDHRLLLPQLNQERVLTQLTLRPGNHQRFTVETFLERSALIERPTRVFKHNQLVWAQFVGRNDRLP